MKGVVVVLSGNLLPDCCPYLVLSPTSNYTFIEPKIAVAGNVKASKVFSYIYYLHTSSQGSFNPKHSILKYDTIFWFNPDELGTF